MERPLILVTNDDGIDSSGLWAAAEALAPLGDVWVVAPDQQWSGSGRSMPRSVTGKITRCTYADPRRQSIPTYAIDATPALCIIHAMLELVDRTPALVVSGINFGENISTEVTISGTIGAALEAAAFGVPALAVSVEMLVEDHLSGSASEDYVTAKTYTAEFARYLLDHELPHDISVLSVNIPQGAAPDTPWRLTRLSRKRYFLPTQPNRQQGEGRPGYRVMEDPSEAEKDSDVWCLRGAKMVSVTPLSIDLTARIDFHAFDEQLQMGIRPILTE